MPTDDLRIALYELLRKMEGENGTDFLREAVRKMAQALMELEVNQQTHAERYERTGERTTYRNGYRERAWDTRVGTIDLQVPRVRDGSYVPALLEPRRRAERALVAVVQEAYVQGVSTRRVDDLIQSLGMQGISKRQVSRLCQELDEEVERLKWSPWRWSLRPVFGRLVTARYGGLISAPAKMAPSGPTSSKHWWRAAYMACNWSLVMRMGGCAMRSGR